MSRSGTGHSVREMQFVFPIKSRKHFRCRTDFRLHFAFRLFRDPGTVGKFEFMTHGFGDRPDHDLIPAGVEFEDIQRFLRGDPQTFALSDYVIPETPMRAENLPRGIDDIARARQKY